MKNGYETITSRQNPLLVLTAKLADKKHREKEGLFRFDGKKLFLEALSADLPLEAVLLKESTAPSFLAHVQAHGEKTSVRVAVLPDALFDRMSEEKSPEGVICLCRYLTSLHRRELSAGDGEGDPFASFGRVLVLESVRDPGNLGTILRTARAFGVGLVALSSDCADLYNPRTVRAAMGALFAIPTVQIEDIVSTVSRAAAHRRVLAAALTPEALRLGELQTRADDILVVGNEGHGLSPAMLAAATSPLYIPMEPGVESLNAGIAASVLLWEFYRR